MATEANKPIRLDREKWMAIYYGLSAARRELDRDRKAGIWDESLAGYYFFLEAVQQHIGFEDEKAHRYATPGIDSVLRWVQRDIAERIREILSDN